MHNHAHAHAQHAHARAQGMAACWRGKARCWMERRRGRDSRERKGTPIPFGERGAGSPVCATGGITHRTVLHQSRTLPPVRLLLERDLRRLIHARGLIHHHLHGRLHLGQIQRAAAVLIQSIEEGVQLDDIVGVQLELRVAQAVCVAHERARDIINGGAERGAGSTCGQMA